MVPDNEFQSTESENPSPKISKSAFARLDALRQAYQDAAKRLNSKDDYPDFFVEGSGPPWHERWPEVVSSRKEFGEDRMLFVDRLNQDDYPDFFVEGSGPPWHERWPEVISARLPLNPSDLHHRVRALRGLNVMKAFDRMRESS
jgi:hypothetical protein